MAAKNFWSRERADAIIQEMLPAFGPGAHDVSQYVKRVVVCGDTRRQPGASAVKHLGFVVVIGGLNENIQFNIPDLRAKVKANVLGVYPGSPLRVFRAYDFVELPDDSGNVSWVVIPENLAGAATLHMTGPISFVKMVELFAEHAGFRFAASGLKKADVKYPTPDEETVFATIGAKYVPVEARETARMLEPL